MKDLSLKQKKEKDLKKQYKSNTRNKEKTWHYKKFMISRKKKFPELEHSETKKDLPMSKQTKKKQKHCFK